MKTAQVFPLGVPCTYCGASVGQKCINRMHPEESYSPTASHQARRLSATAAASEVESNWVPDSTGGLVNGLKQVDELANRFDKLAEGDLPLRPDYVADATMSAEERAQKIDNVLWGIKFSRDIIGMPQHEIDQRMAEMIVDGGFFDVSR